MKSRTRTTLRASIAMLALLLMSSLASAAVPDAPTNLQATPDSNPGYKSITVTWEMGANPGVGCVLYMSSDAGASYRIVARTYDSTGAHRTDFIVGPLANGTYKFYVTAFNNEGTSPQSNVATVVLTGAGIRFTRDWRSDSASVGVPYQAAFNAESSDGGAIVYSLANAASGMAIDATTGVFTWTPPTAGYYNVDIVASLASDATVTATMTHTVVVQFQPADLCAKISGTVSNGKGITIPYGRAIAVHTIGGLSTVFSSPITNGHFEIAVPAGTSIVRFDGGPFESEYYNNAAKEQDAEPITVGCGDDRQLSVTVQSFRPNVIQGTLADTSGARLFGTVTAYRVDNGAIGSAVTTWARDGQYYISNLPPGEYVVWGTGGDSVSGDSSHVPGYHVSGENAAISWTDATRITIGENDTIMDVDITLVHVFGFQGNAFLEGSLLSDAGSIRKGNDAGILGLNPVVGAHVFAVDAANRVAGYATSNAAGHYSISGLAPGTFTVLADLPGMKPLWTSANVTSGGTTLDLQLQPTSSAVPNAPASTIVAGVYPNPVDRAAVVRFSAAAGSARIVMSDLRGEQVLSRTITTVAGENTMTIETSDIPAGVYLLRLGTASSAASIMVTIAH